MARVVAQGAHRGARPDRARRQQAWRQRQHRRQPRWPRPTRRLHLSWSRRPRSRRPTPSLFKSDHQPVARPDADGHRAHADVPVSRQPGLDVQGRAQLVALAKVQSGQAVLRLGRPGTPPHLAGELFKQSTGHLRHRARALPRRCARPAGRDGQPGRLRDRSGHRVPAHQGGKVKLLAVASDKKSPFFPDVPTYADLGIKDAEPGHLVRHVGAQQHAAEVTTPHERRARQGAGWPSAQAALRATWAPSRSALDNAEFKKLLAQRARQLSR
jgi:hypothetical protein